MSIQSVAAKDLHVGDCIRFNVAETIIHEPKYEVRELDMIIYNVDQGIVYLFPHNFQMLTLRENFQVERHMQ